MTLEDLFKQLANTTLRNLSWAETGVIPVDKRQMLTYYVNDALIALYSRFPLKENDLLLQLYQGITTYRLIPRFAYSYTPTSSSDDEPHRYIWDLNGEPFKDDLIKITDVFTHSGDQVPLNDLENPYSVFTPQDKVLQVPNPRDDIFLNVKYRQRHVQVQGELSEWIDIPAVLQSALTSYIAYKVFSDMNSQDSTNKAQEFLGRYENVCNEVVMQDLINSSVSQTNTRFERGGWC